MLEKGDVVICFDKLGTVMDHSWNETMKEFVYKIKWGHLILNNVTCRELVHVKEPND